MTADKELRAACYSISWSARPRSVGRTVRPNVLAVRWLMTSSNLLACTTGGHSIFRPFAQRPEIREHIRTGIRLCVVLGHFVLSKAPQLKRE